MLTFIVTDEEIQKAKPKVEEHQKTCKPKPGTVGDCYSYICTPTGIGTFVSLKCPCGWMLMISDMDNF